MSVDMDAGIPTTGLRVAGVPIGNDEWVQQFVQEKAAAVQVDVGKLDIYLTVSFTIRCCVSAKTLVLPFLGAILQHPTGISDIFAKVDATIFEALCRKVQLTLMANGLLSFDVLLT